MVACCCPKVTEENAEAGLSGAASGAEVATAGASGEAEEVTGEDTAQERWTPGEIHSDKKGPFINGQHEMLHHQARPAESHMWSE